MKAVVSFLAVLFIAFPLFAQSPAISHDPRELGLITLTELSIRDGKLVFRAASNGCTDESSFKARIRREAGTVSGVPAYRLAIERVRIDDCKMLVLEGVQIELDLAKDLGITGTYSLSIDNPMAGRPGSPQVRTDQTALRRALLDVVVRSIEMEIDRYTSRLQTARAGTGPKENIEKFSRRIEELQAEKVRFSRMAPEDYPLPNTVEPDAGSVLEQSAGFGPVLPPRQRIVPAVVDSPCADGTLLSGTGASRSGPFYHLAGIKGNDYGVLKRGRSYSLTLYLVYRREYFGAIGDYYVYVADVH